MGRGGKGTIRMGSTLRVPDVPHANSSSNATMGNGLTPHRPQKTLLAACKRAAEAPAEDAPATYNDPRVGLKDEIC